MLRIISRIMLERIHSSDHVQFESAFAFFDGLLRLNKYAQVHLFSLYICINVCWSVRMCVFECICQSIFGIPFAYNKALV